MSLIAEILKASATKATSVVVDAQTRITLGVGDLLKLPQGTNVQTLRQGTDLVVIIDNGDGLPPDRVVVQGFFAAGSLGMVQIGEDGAAEMVTPRSDVAQVPGTNVTPNAPTAPAETPVVVAEQDGGRVQAQVFEDLGVNDAQGSMFGAEAATEARSELVDVLDGSGVPVTPLPLAGVSEFSFGFDASVANLEPPVIFAPTNGPWVNAAAKQSGYTLGGQGIDGMLVEVQFIGSSGQKVSMRVPVLAGQWSMSLNGDQIETLGEGGVALAATHLSQAGQAFSQPSFSSLFIDTLPPEVPTLQASSAINTAVANNSWLSAKDVAEQELSITVFAEPGSTLVLTLSDAPLHTTTLTGVADANGRYVFDIKPALTALEEDGLFVLKDGLILYKVDATDVAGNTRTSIEPSFNLRQTMPAEPIVVLGQADDTGISNQDGITNDTTPTFVGTVAIDQTSSSTAKIQVYRDVRRSGVFDGVASADEWVATLIPVNGQFSYTATLTGSNDDLYQYLFVAEDLYGNQSSATPVAITLDTVAQDLSLNDISEDNRLSYTELLAATVNVSGEAEPNATVTVSFRNGLLGFDMSTTANAAGNWSLEVPSNVTGPDEQATSLRYAFGSGFKGDIVVSVVQTDVAGNVSTPVSESVYLRTQPVDQVSALGFADGDDTGLSSTDGITKLSQFQIAGVGPASEPGQSNMWVAIYSDTNNNGVVDLESDTLLAELLIGTDGNFSGKVPSDTVLGDETVVPGAFADGSYQLITVVRDTLSGTSSSLSGIKQRLSVQVDTQVGQVTFDTVAVNDIVTLDELALGSLTITGKGERGAKVSLVLTAGTAENTNYNSVPVDGNGNWSVQVSRADFLALGSGPVSLRASQTDVAGNVSNLVNNVAKDFQVRLGVLETPSNLRLLAADDNGKSDLDGVTSQSTGLRFTGNAEPGYIIKLFNDVDNDGVLDASEQLGASYTVGVDGTFEIQADLPQGNYNLRVQAFDAEGQSSGPTSPYTVRVDQSADAPVVVQVTSDGTINAQEAINNVANFTGTAESQSDLELRFFRDGVLVHEKTSVSSVDGVWALDLSHSEVQALQSGAHANSIWTVQTRQTDKAGNVSVWTERAFHIDTAAPSATSAANDQAAADYNNSPERAWRDASGADPVLWSEAFGFDSGMIVPKTLNVAVGLLADVELNETVQMLWGTQTVLHTVTAEDLERGYALVGISGDRIERNRLDSASDTVNVRASFVDIAGNESALVDVISGMQVTLAGDPPTLAPLSDAYTTVDGGNGSFSVFYSNKNRDSNDVNGRIFSLNGRAGSNELLVVFNDANMDGVAQDSEKLGWDPLAQQATLAEVMANEAGNYSINLSLLPGSYNLRAIPIASPNASPSEVVRVVIDSEAPGAPVLSSTLISGGFISANERDNVQGSGVVLTGTGEAGATINVQLVNLDTGVSGTIYRDVRVSAQGQWSAPVGVVQWGQVGDGTISVRLTQTDRAGNTSGFFTVNNEPPTVVFDTVVKAATVLQVTTDDMLNNAESQTGQLFRGTGEVGATVAVTFVGSNGSVGPVNATVNSQGLWEYTLLSSEIRNALGDGLLAINVIQTDLAGNTSVLSTRVVTIDTQANAPQIGTLADDNAIHAGERDTGVNVDGTAEAGAAVLVRFTGSNGTVIDKTVTAFENGAWTLRLVDTEINSLGQGATIMQARQTDKAGNLSEWSAPRTITIATAPLTPPVTVDPVTGDNQVVVAEQAGNVVLQGGGPANTTLQLSVIGQRGTVNLVLAVNASGRWTTDLTPDVMQNTLGPGVVTAQAYAVNAMQQSTATTQHDFTIELQEPSPTFTRVASDNYVNATEATSTVVLDGGGVIGHVVELTITGTGASFSRSAVVGDDRKWSVNLSVGDLALLQNGVVTVTGVQKASGAPGAATSITTSTTFTIDTVAPSAPNASDTSGANAYNSNQSELAGGVTVAEATDGVVVALALPADAVAGDRFTLRWGEQEITQVITAAMVPTQGSRIVYVPVPAGTLITQGDGTFDITAVFSDIAGNVRPTSVVVPSLVVRAPPSAPSVNTVYSDGYINALEFSAIQAGGTAEIKGNAPDGGTIRLTLTHESGTNLTLPPITVAGGAWTAYPTAAQMLALGEGRIFVNAVYTNATGASSSPSQADFIFDKTIPLVPEADSANAVLASEANARSVLAGGLIRNNNGQTDEERKTEAASPVLVNVALAKSDEGVNDVKSGDTLTLLWGSQQINAVVTEADLARGYAQVLVSNFVMSLEGDNDALQVKARVTDKAGNTGAEYLVWTGKVDAIPLTPEVNAVSVDSYLNLAEADAGWQVTGQGSVGGRVVVTLLGTNTTGNVPNTIVSAEIPVVIDPLSDVPRWSLILTKAQATFLGEGRIKITSVQYDENDNASDPGRNPSDPSIRYFNIDTVVPNAPTIGVISGNDRVSFTEGQSPVTISGTGESDATVTVTIEHGIATPKTKTATVVDGTWSVELSPAELAELGGGATPLLVTAKVIDAAGNESTQATRSFLYTTDQVAIPEFTSVTGITPGTDAAFNLADFNTLSVGQPFTVSGTASASAPGAINNVRLSIETEGGANLIYIIEVQTNGTWSKQFASSEFSALGQGKVKLSAVLINSSGDESLVRQFATGNGDNSFLIDTVLPSLAVATVSANGLNGNAKAGDTITVTVQASEALGFKNINNLQPPTIALDLGSGQTRNAVYSSAQSNAAGPDKLVFTYTVQAGDSAVSVQAASTITLNGATMEDSAGNQPLANTINSVPSSTLRVDTVAPVALSIDSVDAALNGTPGQVGADNKVNFDEAALGVKARVNLSAGSELLGTKAKAGDTVELSWSANMSVNILTKTLTATDITNGYTDVSINAGTIGLMEGSATLSVRLVDESGNTSPASAQQVVLIDTIKPDGLSIQAWLDDNKVNKSESDNVGLNLILRGGALESAASVTAVLQQGLSSFTLTPELNYGNGTWSISSAEMRSRVDALGDGSFTVTVTQTDAAGNVGSSTVGNYFIDRGVPNRPTITGIPVSGDGWINLRDAETVGVRVLVSLLNTNAVAGDTLVVGGFTNEFRYTITATDVSNGAASVLVPASAVLQVAGVNPALGRAISARIEDQGGNVSQASDILSVNIDTNIVAPDVDTTVGAAAGISKNQAKSPVDFFGSGVEVGAQVSVFFTGVLGSTLLSTATGQAGGLYKVTLQPNDMASLGDGLVSYRVVQTDAALNMSTERVGSFDLRLSTPLPTLLNVTEDNVVSAIEAANANTVYQGLGVANALVKVNFYVRGDDGIYKTDPEIPQKTATVGSNGFWQVNLSTADLANLSKKGQGDVQIKATQIDDGSESGEADLEFYVDRLPPSLATAKNLFSYSQNFDNTAWIKGGATVQTNVVAAPDGNQTAEALVPNFGTSAPFANQVSQVQAGQTYTYSVYLRNGTANLPWVEMTTSGDATRRQWFNTSTGQKTGTAAETTMTKIEGTDWWRASMTFTATASTADTFWVVTRPSSGSTGSVTGDGIKPSVLLWGAQLELGSTATAYQKIDALPALSLFDANGDGANNDGLLVTFAEPVAVNLLTNKAAYTPSGGKTLGKDFRIEAVDSESINGQFYATKFKLFMDSDRTVVAGDTISIAATSIRDAGGNPASLAQVLIIPNVSVPGLPTPPVDIMSDNRINLEESSNVTRLTFTDTNTASQLSAARGGLLQTKVQTNVNGVVAERVIDEVLPVANFLTMDLTLSKAAKLLQGQSMQANVLVTYTDNTTATVSLFTTGTAATQATATDKYRFTSQQAVNINNIANVTYVNNSATLRSLIVPQTIDLSPVNPDPSGLKITSTGSGPSLVTTIELTLDFGNQVRLNNNVKSDASVYVYFTDLARWEIVTPSTVGTPTTANGVTQLTYTMTVNRPIAANNNFYWDAIPTNVNVDPAITVVTSGANAPVITTAFNSSVVVKTSDLVDGGVMTTQLLDKDLNPIAGTQDTVTYSTSNPNQVLYTQSLSDALSAAGRRLQLYVDGKPAGAPTTMGISEVTLIHAVNWENQFGNSSGWLHTVNLSLQAGAKVTSLLTVTFKSVLGVTPPPVDVLVTATGGTGVNVGSLRLTGAFVRADNGQAIDPTTVANVAYKPNSISQNFPNHVIRSSTITTSQWIDLPASVWAGETEGLKQLTAQMTTADGTLTSVFSAPKQIRLDQKVGSVKEVSLLNDANNDNTLNAGDWLQVRFTENVAFSFSALPQSFGTNPTVTPVGSENGFAQVWNVRLGTGATIQTGQGFTLEARKVFDQAGNDNGSGLATPTVGTVSADIMARAGTPIIDNVSDDNVISSTSATTPVKVNLTKAKAGDVVKLFMDGVEVGSQAVAADAQANVTFTIAGSQWGADGERTLTTEINRPSTGDTVKSALRSVYVASDTTHWSQEAAYAGRVHWFDPDAIVQADGTMVQTWKASAGGLTVATSDTQATKIVDALTGHAYMVMGASSAFYETKAGTSYLYQPATMARFLGDTSIPGAGYTNFSMFKPTVAGANYSMVMQVPVFRFTGNSTPVTYVAGNVVGGTPVTVAPYTKWLGSQEMGYFFSGGTSTTRLHNHWHWWGDMENVISVGAWQMVTAAVTGHRLNGYNQMRFNITSPGGAFIPSATTTLAAVDYQNQSVDSGVRRFRIGGGGAGIVGDQINVTVDTGWAYQQEVGAYLGAKYQSTGSVVARNADANNTTYDLSISDVPDTLIDQNLKLTDSASNDTVTTAGADYVNTGAGADVVRIKDLAFRHIDAGQGNDTLTLAPGFTGRSTFVLSDFTGNYRGLTSTLGMNATDKAATEADNARVNDAGYHRLLGFEKIDLVQQGELENRRQVVTVAARDVKAISDTGVLEVRLGKEDVLKGVGFADNFGVEGIYKYNGQWYDRKFSQAIGGELVEMYTNGGDRMPEAVSFKAVAALNQVQITFDHAMSAGSMLASNFSITTFPSSSLVVLGATSVNLRQGVALTLSGPLNVAAKITYIGDVADEAGRGFRHNTWLLGTNGGDTLSGATLSESEQARGVTFMGGTGADTITGTTGADLIIGGLGGDVLTGGLGSDTFLYRNEITGSGGAGSLGGTSGDVITDFTFNHTNRANNDRIDLSSMFEKNFEATGHARTDAERLIDGGFLDLRKVINFQTGNQDLQIWVDRDGASSGGGGSLYGQLATIADGASNLTSDYPTVEDPKDFLTRLLDEGRFVVSTF
jgi:UDP-3-O-acyl-N-acetylglucosamine deacetylase